ncbi:hypothetical protein BGZ76_011487 [Entomortierella beljakovae]|nr:hypothetical protein BGZ76_011487 [Entomortierella beljakovae]
MEPGDNKSGGAKTRLSNSGETDISTSEFIILSGNSNVKTPTQKRARQSGVVANDGIHKPFRSPMRAIKVGPHVSSQNTDNTKKISSSTDSFQFRKIESGSQIVGVSIDESTLSEAPQALTPSVSSTSSAQRPKSARTFKQKPFRSPVHGKGTDLRHPRDGASSRRIQIGALQARILELKSSIRKAQQIVQQQEKTDTPLLELTEKWKKACQDGAQILLEKYTDQEQFYGDGNALDPGYYSKERLNDYSSFDNWGYVSALESSSQNGSGLRGLSGLNPHQIEAMEDCMESQDLLHDLPTVEEAIKLKVRPEIINASPMVMTKMKRLLLGLGIDPVVVGYNEEQDSFTSEDLELLF